MKNFYRNLLLMAAVMLLSSAIPANENVAGLEIPTYNKQLSQTVKHRTAYTVSYNHDTRQPNWVA